MRAGELLKNQDTLADLIKPACRFILILLLLLPASGQELRFEVCEIDPMAGRVCYAVCEADLDSDGDLDVLALIEDAVHWYENPSWNRHTIARGLTPTDNVCFAPKDIDHDGDLDLALGAGWATREETAGTWGWLRNDGSDRDWTFIRIGVEPSTHRMTWANLTGSGQNELVVIPLQGREARGPRWNEGTGVRILVATVPTDPTNDTWPIEVADATLHTTHNAQAIDLDQDGRDELLIGAWEGLFLLDRSPEGMWSRTQLGRGDVDAKPFPGVSEIKVGRIEDGSTYLATIEPWHGHRVVVYTPPRDQDPLRSIWTRQVIDQPARGGHAIGCADLNGDGSDEIVMGHREPNREDDPGPRGPGIRIYSPRREADGSLTFGRSIVEDGGVAVEDLRVADLDHDGRPDLIAGGRSTQNVRIYFNRTDQR